ncbi:facilitated trehalose transporter Tret1-like [Penaeus japonicus]|uniref:facilitated trehalose transporter Tret1-like n=1 Tax=Penaeus japonicus TaxID=27405 RepID=UPI001C70B8CE|nr:facilitated trehalose transporter Tret1-like [Penaeus japonicus]XP_042874104.1 facilitated trehalose transporter Tret1-like [Penaeus japonicus]
MAEPARRQHILYQVMAATAVGVATLVASLAMGYTSPALPSMRADPQFSITEEEESWVGAVMPACALLGSMVTGPMVDSLGRRTTLIVLCVPFVMSWVMIAMASGVGGVVLGRMVGGVCVGVQAVAGSVFMPEVVQLDLRDAMAFFPAVLGNLGLLVSFAAGQYLTWRGLAWLGAALCVPMALLLFPLPETPHHLTRTGRKEESLAALRKLRCTAEQAEKEQEEISTSCSGRDEGQSVSVWDIVRPPNQWPVGVAAALMLTQQATGINAVVFYASTILETGGSGMGGGSASVLLGVVNFLGAFVGMFAMATYKRRSLITASTVVLLISLLTLSFFFWAQEAGGSYSEMAEGLGMLPVVALLAYMVGFAVGWGPVPWIFLGEGMPSNVRGIAVAVVVALNWASAFLVTKTFAWSVATLGTHTTFLAYAAVTGVSAALIHGVMPETYGKSMLEMDRLYVEAHKKKEE